MSEPHVEVVVVLDVGEVLAGRLWIRRRHGSESATFAYDPDYVARPGAYPLDPSLPLDAAPHHTPPERAMFGAFSDSSPDRWGRRLIHRDERQRAELEGTAERSFGEGDYLLGVRDDLRQGAVRFRHPGTGAYLAEEDSRVPHLLDLPRLLGAADRLERDEADAEELRLLLRGGSSLGGARPKAHVLDQDHRLAIAKFPSPANDEWDVIRWEAVALSLARSSGVDVPRFALEVIDRKPVLIIDRFDRAGTHRIGYASAMTLLELSDGDHASYLDIAAVIEEQSPHASRDLERLWRRMAFTVLIRNTDDHLRNHGFLRTSSSGWTLSPAFDINPDPAPGTARLSTSLDYDDPRASLEPLLAVAEYFRLSDDGARHTLHQVARATAQWRNVAARIGVPGAEIDLMRRAFDHDEALAARAIG